MQLETLTQVPGTTEQQQCRIGLRCTRLGTVSRGHRLPH